MLAAVLIFGAFMSPVVPHHAAVVPAVHHVKVHVKHHAHHGLNEVAKVVAHKKHVLHLMHLESVRERYLASQQRYTGGSSWNGSASHSSTSSTSSGSSSSSSGSTGGSSWQNSSASSGSSSSSYSSHTGTAGNYSGGISDIPGVPKSFVACVARRESNNGANQAYNGGTYGIISASGYNVNGQSLSAQKAAFQKIYTTTGRSAWSKSDNC